MAGTILTLAIASEHDTVAARQRARQIARLLGFDAQDQTRISTAVSEIARNAFNYAGGGRVEYSIEGRTSPQLFIIKIRDTGPGVRDLDNILEGRYKSSTGMGMGIVGARRLMDQFQIESAPGQGTTVWLKKLSRAARRVWNAQDLPGLAAVAGRRGSARCVSGAAASKSGIAQRAGGDPHPADRADPAESGVGRHQSRRSGAVCGTGRESRSSAPRRRTEVAVSVQHEPRVPLAAEFHSGAKRPAAGSLGRRI